MDTSLAVAITGSGGSGAVTTGSILLEAAARASLYGLMTRSAGPQIRGGESASLLRLASRPVQCLDNRFDLLVGLDWRNVDRFVDEVPLDADSLILADPAAGTVPEFLQASGARVIEIPLKEIAGEIDGGRLNMVALGVTGTLLGLPVEAMTEVVSRVLGRKGDAVVTAARVCIERGAERAPDGPWPALGRNELTGERWSMTGNEAAGLGALLGGIRFVAAYPITPASEVLEWMAPKLEQVGGSLLQAEDELASINMIIGGSFGGVPSLTATSGPGLSLMTEGIGLAITGEIPVVVLNVMRGGPSTGIPTKSEQADLNMALYGLHGDAPHVVIAALDIGDCVRATRWAVELAEQLQTAAILLSDQFLGQSRAVIDAPGLEPAGTRRRIAPATAEAFQRYALTDDGISPMAIPGTPGCMYTADGLEHNPRGTPSSTAGDHQVQLDKRRDKLERIDWDPLWAEVRGEGEMGIVTWGSVAGAALEAGERLAAEGMPVRVIALRLLAPLPHDPLRTALQDVTRVLVVEQNHGGQLFGYLRAEGALAAEAVSYARPGPLPISPAEIVAAVKGAQS